MTQDERWNLRYEEVMAFIESNHRNPSKHRIEEHDMLNWLKANRKRMNAGELKPERVEAFKVKGGDNLFPRLLKSKWIIIVT